MRHALLVWLALGCLILLAAPLAAAPAGDPFAGPGPWMVRAWFGDEAMVREVAAWGDHYRWYREEGFVSVHADPERVAALRALGFYVEVDEELTYWIRHAEAAQLDAAARRARGETVESIPGFPCYRTVEETFASAEALAAAHPTLATWTDVGDSWEKVTPGGLAGYDMMVLKLTNTAVPGPKPVLLVDGAIHAREYATAELVTRFAEQLVAGYGTDADTTWLLDHHEIHLMLHANPDGRKHAETGIWWRKNTNEAYCGVTSQDRGADLNRNFEFQWACCGGSSGNGCSETYRGISPASEPEIQTIQAYMRSVFPDQRENTFPGGAAPADATGVYLNIHSFSQLVLWPWGGTWTPTDNGAALTTLGRKFAYFNLYFPEQSIGLYPTDGTTIDFVYGDLGVAGYVFELGTEFFQACGYFESVILPGNLPALRYAAKAARTPYMTPAGPDALSVLATPAAVTAGEPVELTATLNDTRYSNANGAEPVQPIAQAEVYVDLPPWAPGATPVAMSADDGAFDETVEPASATIDTTCMAAGRHLAFVRGRDSAGADFNWGAVSGAFFEILPGDLPFADGFEAGDTCSWSMLVP